MKDTERMNVSEWRRFVRQKPQKRHTLATSLSPSPLKKEAKYHNKRCEYNGIVFDSYRERDRYIFLEGCQMRGEISNLRRQVRFVLLPDEYTESVVHLKTKDKVVLKRSYIGVDYTADFVYDKDGKMVVEDVKGDKRVVSRDFSLRIKMMHYLKGIDVRVVCNATEKV